MATFGRAVPVEIVRGRGTTEEKRWSALMAGNLATNALFQPEDRVRTGDEIHCELFDEPRVLTAVHPDTSLSGDLSCWKAEMVPQSRWNRQNQPAAPTFNATGQGARINVGSIDRSVQQFHNARPEFEAVLRELDSIKSAIAQLASGEDRDEAAIDVEQITQELQRSRPHKGRVWQALERLHTITGLGEKTAKLGLLLNELLDKT